MHFSSHRRQPWYWHCFCEVLWQLPCFAAWGKPYYMPTCTRPLFCLLLRLHFPTSFLLWIPCLWPHKVMEPPHSPPGIGRDGHLSVWEVDAQWGGFLLLWGLFLFSNCLSHLGRIPLSPLRSSWWCSGFTTWCPHPVSLFLISPLSPLPPPAFLIYHLFFHWIYFLWSVAPPSVEGVSILSYDDLGPSFQN